MITEVLKYIRYQKKEAMLNKENVPLLPHNASNVTLQRMLCFLIWSTRHNRYAK